MDFNRRRTLWVIDDSATDAERVRRALSGDYNVEIIADGAVALERLSSSATPDSLPDLMLVDWVMPGISGIEVCQFARSASPKIQQVPIILLTAQHGSEEIVQAFHSGANDYISKPFVDEELKARVKTLIGTRKLLERAEKAEADVRTLLMKAPDPIFAVDASGNISFSNDEGLQALGLTKENVLGAALSTLIPDISLRNIIVGPGASLLPLPDVRIGDRLYSPSLRILPSDSAASTTISLRDVTDRRRDEARRLDFYSVIAHDLRTPITSVLMRLQLAFRGKHGVLPATLIADLRKIEASLRSQVGMVNDFLELAKLEGVGYKIDRKPVEICDLINATMDDFQPLLEKSKLEWKHEGCDQPAHALGDHQRLSQVLANLVGNAIKFTPGPGVITTRVVVTDDHIETSVTDTGRGIAHDELPHLFERFTRARESENEILGTGLGLMIVREIVEAHSGVIGVESEPGRGSRFWFRLPRCQETLLINRA